MKYLPSIEYLKSNAFSLITVCISVSYILFVISVNLNLYNQTLDKLLSIQPHITINRDYEQFYKTKKIINDNYNNLILEDSTDDRFSRIVDYKQLLVKINDIDSVRSYTLSTKAPGVILFDGFKEYLYLNIIVPSPNINITKYMSSGRFIEQEDNQIVIGQKLANKLKAKFNDRLTVVTPIGTNGPFKLAGMFETGFNNIDKSYAYLPYKETFKLLDEIDAVGGIDIELYDYKKAQKVAEEIRNKTGYKVTSWIDEFNEIYKAGLGFGLLKWFVYLLFIPILALNLRMFGCSFSLISKLICNRISSVSPSVVKNVEIDLKGRIILIALAFGIISGFVLVAVYNFFVVFLLEKIFDYNMGQERITFLGLFVLTCYLLYLNKKRL